MTLIGEVLQSEHVKLALAGTEETAVVNEVLAKLNGDPRIKDFAALRDAIFEREIARLVEHGCAICVAHGRTESVSSLVMAAGRSSQGIQCPGIEEPARLFFVAGIPSVFNAEYLRSVGAIARICSDRQQLQNLLHARDERQFLEVLGAGEVKL